MSFILAMEKFTLNIIFLGKFHSVFEALKMNGWKVFPIATEINASFVSNSPFKHVYQEYRVYVVI